MIRFKPQIAAVVAVFGIGVTADAFGREVPACDLDIAKGSTTVELWLIHRLGRENPAAKIKAAIGRDIIEPLWNEFHTGPAAPVPFAMVGMLRMLRGGAGRPINLTPATQTIAYDIKTAAGSPTDKVAITLTIGAGVSLQQTLTTNTSGTFASGSTIATINLGIVAGKGGIGGTGGGITGASTSVTPTAGTNGDPAIIMNWPMTFDNTSGQILGGPGGGGGGGFSSVAAVGAWNTANANGGGGGGGARGYTNPSGGAGGSTLGGTGAGFAGSAGSSSSKGAHGAGGISFAGGKGGDGGDGGDWGANGSNGVNGSFAGANAFDLGASGGLAGNAVTTNGFTLTPAGGFGGAGVKGAIV